MNLDPILEKIRSQEPDPVEIEQAAARVKARLFPAVVPQGADSVSAGVGTIKSCGGFRVPLARLPRGDAGPWPANCCLKSTSANASPAATRWPMPATARDRRLNLGPRKAATRNYAGWALAASVTLGRHRGHMVWLHAVPGACGRAARYRRFGGWKPF